HATEAAPPCPVLEVADPSVDGERWHPLALLPGADLPRRNLRRVRPLGERRGEPGRREVEVLSDVAQAPRPAPHRRAHAPAARPTASLRECWCVPGVPDGGDVALAHAPPPLLPFPKTRETRVRVVISSPFRGLAPARPDS